MPNTAVFHPSYFPSILQYAMMLQKNPVLFEVNDHFQKQTYRNRCYIYGANGKQLLNVPITKKSGKQVSKDVLVNYDENWQKEHVKSLISAYKSSPFFEFYIDDLMPIFTKKEKYLVDLNIAVFQLLNDAIQVEIPFELTADYQLEFTNDFRFLVNAKQETNVLFPKYIQVFQEKHSFIPNLSILDLLFNEGPNTEMYLMKI
ncbi:MAG TPA: hypothetical protein ENK67_04300 [Flavobacteriia bacterium]|nr:hypothetical protein [Flavobacteriia bacterium]